MRLLIHRIVSLLFSGIVRTSDKNMDGLFEIWEMMDENTYRVRHSTSHYIILYLIIQSNVAITLSFQFNSHGWFLATFLSASHTKILRITL